MLISSSEALNQIMQHVGRSLNVDYEQVRVNASELQTANIEEIDDDALAKNARAFDGTGATRISKNRLTFEDVRQFVEELFGSGVVTGLIQGKPVDQDSFADPANYHALLRGDIVTMPARSKSTGHIRETGAPLTGPLLIDDDELSTALANSKPEMDQRRIKLGGRKPTMQVAVALGAWVLSRDPSTKFDDLLDRVSGFYDEQRDGSENRQHLERVLEPLFEIHKADLTAGKAGKDEDECESVVLAVAQRYTDADAIKNNTRIVRNGANKTTRKRR